MPENTRHCKAAWMRLFATQKAKSQRNRLINKVPGRERADIFAIAAKQLPPLSERQLKFFEAQDRKLKALQKSAQKEQNDVLGIFDAASADFQRLLAEASSASLHAARSPPFEAAIEKTS